MKIIYQYPYLSINEIKMLKQHLSSIGLVNSRVINLKKNYDYNFSLVGRYFEIEIDNSYMFESISKNILADKVKLPLSEFGIVIEGLFLTFPQFTDLINKLKILKFNNFINVFYITTIQIMIFFYKKYVKLHSNRVVFTKVLSHRMNYFL